MIKKDPPAQCPLPRRLWWPWDQPVQRVGFACTFAAATPAPAILYVSASGPYAAWLDGTPLTAPDMPCPSWRVMHRIGINLLPGTHELRIAAEPGAHGQPFLLCCLDWEEEGRAWRVASDATWQMIAEPAPGWQQAQPDDGWRPAWAFDGVWAEPWAMPANAPDDFCRLSHGWQTVTIERVAQVVDLRQGLTTVGAWAGLAGDGVLRLAPARPYAAAPPSLENTRPHHLWEYTHKAQALAHNAWLELFAQRAPFAVYDLGAETFARVRLTLRGGGSAILAVSTGESLPEVHTYSRRFTDIFSLRDGETFTTTPAGFRYIKLTALSSGGEAATIEPLEVQHIRYPAEQIGSFRCDDPVLTRVWALSARTLWLCLQNEVWDGIKRDQRAWMGDLWVEALVAYHLFADQRLVRHTLAVLAELGPGPARPLEQQRYPGLLASWKTTTGDINDIPSYTLWWVIGLADYLRYTGDHSLIEEVAGDLAATLEHVASWVGEDGIWRFQSGWDFVDWAPLSAAEREVFCHLLACQVLTLGADLLEGAGRPVAPYRAAHVRMVDAARAAWWRGGDATLGAAHHLHAMAIRSGVLTDAEAALLFDRHLAGDPPMTMTYWHRYADLDAARRVGRVQWGLDSIRRHWGQALQVGMTTLWEAFDAAWIGPDPHGATMIGAEFGRYGGYETSLCHGWSAGPAAWLHEAILGVRPVQSGFTVFDFIPSLGDLQWAEGSIPTPHGAITVSLHREEGARFAARLTLPPGVEPHVPAHVTERWQVVIE
jgi:alpha-L-rhamnosidase